MAKKGLALEDQKKLTAIFRPKIVWHEMFVKFLLNLKRDSKLKFCFFVCVCNRLCSQYS